MVTNICIHCYILSNVIEMCIRNPIVSKILAELNLDDICYSLVFKIS